MEIDVFDFDGTLIQGDSIKLFAKWVCDTRLEFLYRYYICFLPFKNLTELKFSRSNFFYTLMTKKNKKISDFNNILNNALFNDSLDLIKSDNFPKVVVSASFDELIGSYCRDVLGVKLIANRLSLCNQDINYAQKVVSLKNEFGYHVSLRNAFGNSHGDFALLRKSKFSFFRTKNGEIINWVDPTNLNQDI